MAGWIGCLNKTEARGNWEICRKYEWFGSPNKSAAGVRTDDDVFIWWAEKGLTAHCVATGDAEKASGSFVPWPRPEAYEYVFPIDIVREFDYAVEASWPAVRTAAGIRTSPQWFPKMSDTGAQSLSHLFSTGRERVARVMGDSAAGRDLDAVQSEMDARIRTHRAIRVRQGQGRFRTFVLAAYQGRCCVSDCDVPAALEAAHIAPYRGNHTNEVWNGLLLRADVHTLFDLGLLTVLLDGQVRVAPQLDNSSYSDLDRRRVRFPQDPESRPAREVLQAHNRRCGWLD